MMRHDLKANTGFSALQASIERLRTPEIQFREQIEQLLRPQLLQSERLLKMIEPKLALEDAYKHLLEPVRVPQMAGFEKLIDQLQPAISNTLVAEWKRLEQFQKTLFPTLELQQKLEEVVRPSKLIEEQLARSLGAIDALLTHYPLSSVTFDDVGGVSVAGEAVSRESLQQAAQDFQAQADESGDFLSHLFGQLAKLKPAVRALLLYLLLPYIISIVANLTTPLYEQLWKDLTTPRAAGTKSEVRAVARRIFVPGELHQHRFVTAKILSVRQTARLRSPAVSTLRFGKVVRLLQKQKDWCFVEYVEDDSDKVLQGWVLSRYLAKFE